jgi:hypothetical protein
MSKKPHIVALFFLFSPLVILSNTGALAIPGISVSNNNQTGKEVTNYISRNLINLTERSGMTS